MTYTTFLPDGRARRRADAIRGPIPGSHACLVVPLAVRFLSDHSGAPTLLLGHGDH